MKPVIALAAAAALSFAAAQAIAQSNVPAIPGATNSMPTHPSFDQIDSDADGQVSREEAAAAGVDLDWDQVDSDGSGSLSQDEYDSASPGGSMPSDPGLDSDPGLTDPGMDDTDGGL